MEKRHRQYMPGYSVSDLAPWSDQPYMGMTPHAKPGPYDTIKGLEDKRKVVLAALSDTNKVLKALQVDTQEFRTQLTLIHRLNRQEREIRDKLFARHSAIVGNYENATRATHRWYHGLDQYLSPGFLMYAAARSVAALGVYTYKSLTKINMQKYLKDPFFWLALVFIIGIGIAFGVGVSWWCPGIAWPAFAALFYFWRNNP